MLHDMPHPGAFVLGQSTDKPARLAVRATVFCEIGQRLLQSVGEILAAFDRGAGDQHADVEHHADHREVGVNTRSYVNIGGGYLHRLYLFLGG